MTRAPQDDEDTVYVVVGNHGNQSTYHTDEDCKHLKAAKNTRSVDRAVIGDHRVPCQTCQNGGEQPTSNPWRGGHYQSLVDAAKRGESDD